MRRPAPPALGPFCSPPRTPSGRAPPGPPRAAAVRAMGEQLRKIQHDAYYGVLKASAITDLQLTFMARGAPPRALPPARCS